jgi:hypothetical protein
MPVIAPDPAGTTTLTSSVPIDFTACDKTALNIDYHSISYPGTSTISVGIIISDADSNAQTFFESWSTGSPMPSDPYTGTYEFSAMTALDMTRIVSVEIRILLKTGSSLSISRIYLT